MGLRLRRSDVRRYEEINRAAWARFRAGQITGAQLTLQRFGELLAHLGADRRRAPRLSRRYLLELGRRGDLVAGARRALRALYGRYRLGVVTNGYERVQRTRLAEARLDHLFETVVTSERAGCTKPDPRIIEYALEEMGVDRRVTVYVGDDPAVDGEAAAAAGVRYCWMDRGLPVSGRRPRRGFTKLAQLVAWLC